ncbi:MAG: hypothetical protein K1W28_03740 [Lachnospiraceae bacterium]
MAKERRQDYCTKCRKITGFQFTKTVVREQIRGKAYTFVLTAALCEECREAMNVPGLIDLNIRERDEQFRQAENLISLDDIRRLSDLLRAQDGSLSPELDPESLSAYVSGQMPSRQESDLMKESLNRALAASS